MSRLEVLKTYKIYIGGQFPRTESGRFYTALGKDGQSLGNVCLSSKKDVRNAVVAARKAFASWSERSAFNRGQILYRIAEMMEGRKGQFVAELQSQGARLEEATQEVNHAIDTAVYYAGWCDKYNQVLSSVNPVATSHFNFSVLEPMGVVSIIAPQSTALIGLISLVLPAIAGGNTCVVLAAEAMPLCAVTFAEVLHSSDVPGGVVNILTGKNEELNETLSNHLDVNAVVYGGTDFNALKAIQENGALNVKRTFHYTTDWMAASSANLYMIADLQEVKTTWHPIENIGGASSSY
jgi:acyl-CoA reductase-like NAD-dependent aldehyde dehydrogenase